MGSLEQQLETLKSVVHYLRSGTEAEAYEVLRRIRQCADNEMDDTLQLIRDGAMIMDKLSPTNQSSPSMFESPPQLQTFRTQSPPGKRIVLPSLSNLLCTPGTSLPLTYSPWYSPNADLIMV